MAKKGQKFKEYNEEFRLQVIKENIEGKKSARFLSKKHLIPKGTIDTWIYQFKHNGPIRKKRGRPKQKEETNYKEKYEILKKFLESLEGGEIENSLKLLPEIDNHLSQLLD